MYKKLTISAVIPCYNEEKGIIKTLSNMPSYVDEVIVVDNNSTDKSVINAKKFNVNVFSEKRQGYGAALKTGILKAKGDIIVTLDGDGTYNPRHIIDLVKYLGKNDLDFVSACRINKVYKNSYPLLNLLGNKSLSLLTRILFRHKISDVLSGMMCFKSKIVPLFLLSSYDMSFSEEIKIQALRDPKIRFQEYPIEFHDHHRIGEKKINIWRDGLKGLLFLFKARIRPLR